MIDIQSLVTGAVGAAVVAGVFALIQLVVNKRLRTPSDRLAEAQFSVKVYQDQLLEARADKSLNDQTIATLREYAEKQEANGREDQKLVIDLYKQIQALEARNAQKDQKIQNLQALIATVAAKVARGETITLHDLTGTSPLGDLEDTYSKE